MSMYFSALVLPRVIPSEMPHVFLILHNFVCSHPKHLFFYARVHLGVKHFTRLL